MAEKKSFMQQVREGYQEQRDEQRIANAASPIGFGITSAMGLVAIGMLMVVMGIVILIWGLP